MSMRWLFGVLAACSPGPRAETPPDAAPPDASPGCGLDTDALPITVAGSSPDGALDGFRYARVDLSFGSCAEGLFVTLYDEHGTCDPRLLFDVVGPLTAPGSLPATVRLEDSTSEQVTFEATQIDTGTSPAPVVGRFVSHDATWSFDIPIDQPAVSHGFCD